MPSTSAQPAVLLVASDPELSERFGAALIRAGLHVGAAVGHLEADAIMQADPPRLLVVDADLAGGAGRDLCRRWAGHGETTVVAIVERAAAGESIADEQVVKPFGAEQVAARLFALARPRAPTPAPAPRGTVVVDDLAVDLGSGSVVLAGAPVELRPKERALLLRIARAGGAVVTRRELMDDVWGEDRFHSTHTLDVHVRRVRHKLGDDPAASRYLHTVRGVGFRLGPAAPPPPAAPSPPG